MSERTSSGARAVTGLLITAGGGAFWRSCGTRFTWRVRRGNAGRVPSVLSEGASSRRGPAAREAEEVEDSKDAADEEDAEAGSDSYAATDAVGS